MRMRVSQKEGDKNVKQSHKAGITAQQSEYIRYSTKHCWVKMVDENIVRIGLEPMLASVLTSPKAIVLPTIGATVRHGEYCCWIILEDGTFPISSPTEGIVVAANAQVADQPYELNFHPLKCGWLFEVQSSVNVLSALRLMKQSEAEEYFSKDLARFNTLVAGALKRHNSSVGLTMADGGQRMQNVSLMLGAKQYFELVREVFGEKH